MEGVHIDPSQASKAGLGGTIAPPLWMAERAGDLATRRGSRADAGPHLRAPPPPPAPGLSPA